MLRSHNTPLGRHAFVVSLTVSALTACATPNQSGYAIVYDGAVAMRKLPHHDLLKSWPWVDSNQVFISNCGFARITFKEVPIREPQQTYAESPRRESSYLYLMGEWCQAGPALFETNGRTAYLVSYREWGGTKYLLMSARVYHDDDGADYVADPEFIQSNSLQHLIRDLKQGHENTGCFVPTDTQIESIRNSLTEIEGSLCFHTGVYVRDLATRAK